MAVEQTRQVSTRECGGGGGGKGGGGGGGCGCDVTCRYVAESFNRQQEAIEDKGQVNGNDDGHPGCCGGGGGGEVILFGVTPLPYQLWNEGDGSTASSASPCRVVARGLYPYRLVSHAVDSSWKMV